MRRMVKPVALAAWTCWATVSAAQGRAVFDLEEAAWQATHIVVVEIDGEAFSLSESWVGNVGPGARLDCYGLVAVDTARYDDLFTLRQGARYVHGHRYPEGAHPVLGRGVAFVPGAAFYPVDPDRSTLRLSYATSSLAQVEEGVRKLAHAIGEFKLG